MKTIKLLLAVINVLFFILVIGVNISSPQTQASSIVVQGESPQWEKFEPLRLVMDERLGEVLIDIESHIAAGHQYSEPSNLVTWAHETTHGINAYLRNRHKDAAFVNAFYCLENRYKVFYEPRTTLSDVARRIPLGLRGPSYQLYLEQQVKWWNEKPLYVMDEWISYSNGSECAYELREEEFYFELLQAQNFSIYSIYLLMSVRERDPKYDMGELVVFTKWNIERVMSLQKPLKAGILRVLILDPLARNRDYMEKVRTLPEADSMRRFSREVFGEKWCKRVLGF